MPALMTPPVPPRLAPTRAAIGGYREILVHVEPTGLGRRRLDAAIDLAGRFGAELIGLGAETPHAAAGGGIEAVIGGEVAAAAQAVLIDDLFNAESLFRVRTNHIAARWLALQARPTEALARIARSADLIVASGPVQPSDRRAAEVGELVLQAGRPVLIVPSHGRPLRGQAAVVAWKDSREARRAVADALPLLRLAEVVMVMEACAPQDLPEAEERVASVADYLHQHGVEAAGRALPNTGNPARDLKRAAHALGADLIVCGAFGHSRLREAAFGGFTDDMLRAPEHFVLMSH